MRVEVDAMDKAFHKEEKTYAATVAHIKDTQEMDTEDQTQKDI